MAVVAFKHLQMVDVAKTGIKCLEKNILHILVTLLAIPFDRESAFSIMTGSARRPLFHVQHGVTDPVRTRYK